MSSSMVDSSVRYGHVGTKALEVQVTQRWGGNAIAQKDATEGAISFAIGETDVEIAHWEAGELVVTPPTGATLWVDRLMHMSERFILRAGHSADVVVGDFTFQLSVSEREERPARDVAAILEDTGLRTFAGSGIAHALLLASVAFFMPSLSAADDESMDRQRIIALKTYIDSAAEREQAEQPQPAGQDSSGSSSDSGQAAKLESGVMGGSKPVTSPGHWTLKGEAPPENTQLARERALKEAADFGMIGLISSSIAADPNAPIATWGSLPIGADKTSHNGGLLWADAGDAFGTGLGLTGVGEGGGGKGEGIGIDQIGTIGHGCIESQGCVGGPGGFGHGTGRLAPTHVVRGPDIKWVGEVTTNGRLDPAVIQRIVRLNSGRFIGCYQTGLHGNPSLQGRVEVSFVIARDGTVSTAKDTRGSDLPDSDVRACVVRGFQSLEFPEPKGGTVVVDYPFTFTPQ